ncbi:MAG: threonine/serine dehydratase [Actinomycetota bacterium]
MTTDRVTATTVERDDIEAARDRVREHIRSTPVVHTGAGSFGIDTPLVLKLELLQHTGSFKLRGAFNKMLASDVPDSGVVAASGGNFGLAVACAARELGHRAEIFVPDTSPAAKIDRVREQGADVRVIPGYYHEASIVALARQAETGALAMHPFDQPEVVAGAGTIGLELSDQVSDADTILVSVGGGGLIAGIASWFRGAVRVVGVEPERCAGLHAALAAGEPVDVEVGGIAADSLGPRRAGGIAFAAARRWVEEVVLVPDEAIREAQRRLWHDAHLVAEPGGATSLAALIVDAYRPSPDERVVVIVSGANTDPATVV